MGRRRAWHWRVSPNTRRSLAVADKTGSAWCREPICTPCKSVIWYHRIGPYLSLDRTANIWLMISECRSLRRVETLLDGRCRHCGSRLWSLVREVRRVVNAAVDSEHKLCCVIGSDRWRERATLWIRVRLRSSVVLVTQGHCSELQGNDFARNVADVEALLLWTESA